MESNNLLNKVIENQDQYALEFQSYSGRGMFGRTCLGVTHENPVALALLIAQAAFELADEEELETEYMSLLTAFGAARTDNMGRDYIIYWPDLPAPVEMERDYDGEDEE